MTATQAIEDSLSIIDTDMVVSSAECIFVLMRSCSWFLFPKKTEVDMLLASDWNIYDRLLSITYHSLLEFVIRLQHLRRISVDLNLYLSRTLEMLQKVIFQFSEYCTGLEYSLICDEYKLVRLKEFYNVMLACAEVCSRSIVNTMESENSRETVHLSKQIVRLIKSLAPADRILAQNYIRFVSRLITGQTACKIESVFFSGELVMKPVFNQVKQELIEMLLLLISDDMILSKDPQYSCILKLKTGEKSEIIRNIGFMLLRANVEISYEVDYNINGEKVVCKYFSVGSMIICDPLLFKVAAVGIQSAQKLGTVEAVDDFVRITTFCFSRVCFSETAKCFPETKQCLLTLKEIVESVIELSKEHIIVLATGQNMADCLGVILEHMVSSLFEYQKQTTLCPDHLVAVIDFVSEIVIPLAATFRGR